jgi:TetR/AcrR family transcriptional repressor of nem operon
MRKSKREAAETRERIVKAAAAKFRLNGIGGTGLSDLMAAAGLTHGGFYRHFDSKDQIVAEACAAAAESAMAAYFSNDFGRRGVKARVAKYLSPAHRDDPSAGCPLAALGSEIARADGKTRAAATRAFLKLVDTLASGSSRRRPDVAQRRALVAASTMIGALMMSRIVTDRELSAAILRQSEKQLLHA